MRKITSKPTGSILIWTVLLGISLMTVFFYFSQRLNFNAAFQKRSLEYQNASILLNSYADYLENLAPNELQSIQIDYDGLTGFLTNSTPEIISFLDVNQAKDYQVKFGKAKVEWGRCAQQEQGRVLEITPNDGEVTGNCGVLAYDGVAEVTDTIFTLKAGEAPVGYRITPIGNAVLYQQEWSLDLQTTTASGKLISLHRSFKKTLN